MVDAQPSTRAKVAKEAQEAAVRLAERGASFDEILPFKLIELLAGEPSGFSWEGRCRATLTVDGRTYTCDRPEGHTEPHEDHAEDAMWGPQ